jgi:hypothetical protein
MFSLILEFIIIAVISNTKKKVFMHSVQNNSIALQNYPMWKELPKDLSLEVLVHLSPRKVGTCNLVCKQWSQFLNSPEVWQFLSRCHLSYITPGVIKSFQGYVNLYSNFSRQAYSEKNLRRHTDAVWSLVIKGNELFSCSADKTIKRWDLNDYTCTHTFNTYMDEIYSLAEENEKLFYGFSNSVITILDLASPTHACNNLIGHAGGVSGLVAKGGKLFSASLDKTIKMWDVADGTCKHTFEGHTDGVRSLAISDDGNRLFSGSLDKTIKVWDLTTKNLDCVDTLEGHKNAVSALVVKGGKLFSASWDGTVRIWNLATKTFSVINISGEIYSLAVEDNRLFAAIMSPNRVTNWSLSNAASLDFFLNLVGRPHALAAKDGKLCAGFGCGLVRVWDFTAPHAQIFMEIAEALESQSPEKADYAICRFRKMPEAAKNKIFGELHKIVKPKNSYWEWGKDFFYEKERYVEKKLTVTNTQRAQAIRNYVMRPAKKCPT